MTGIDETPVDYSDDLQNKPMDLSGNVNLKTINPEYAPHGAFPTRKYEYSDGTVTWYRPEMPWSWMNGNAETQCNNGMMLTKTRETNNRILIILVILVILAYILKQYHL
jgi:hypothetical protein